MKLVGHLCSWGLLVFLGSNTADAAATPSKLQSGGGFGLTIYKPGECPASDPTLFCYEQKDLCQSDCECPQQQKCCYQENCGNSCKPPMSGWSKAESTCSTQIAPALKPGQCPQPDENIVCIQCYDQCKSDCECEGSLKCCPQPGCGNQCKNATGGSNSCGGCGWKQP